jgi:hypothetical protein
MGFVFLIVLPAVLVVGIASIVRVLWETLVSKGD